MYADSNIIIKMSLINKKVKLLNKTELQKSNDSHYVQNNIIIKKKDITKNTFPFFKIMPT